MPIVLNLIYLAHAGCLAPRSWPSGPGRRGGIREGWVEKLLGRAPLRVGDRPCLWFHAVSVGEVLLLRPLVAEIFARRRPPAGKWSISATTSTGLQKWRGRSLPRPDHLLRPVRLLWATRRAVSRIRPTIRSRVLVEPEVWPNLVRSTAKAGGGTGRDRQRPAERPEPRKGLPTAPWPARGKTFRRFDSVAVQTAEYAERFADLGVPTSSKIAGHRLGEVRRPRRPIGRTGRRIGARGGALGLTSAGDRLRRREHDGWGRRGGGRWRPIGRRGRRIPGSGWCSSLATPEAIWKRSRRWLGTRRASGLVRRSRRGEAPAR